MNRPSKPINESLDKKFVENLLNTLKQQGNKVDAQYLCSAPAPIKIKTN